MTTRTAFLRAVNLGKRQVANKRLIELVEGLGHTDVWTFVNSGNVVFEGTGRRDILQRQLAEAIEAEVGFEVTTFVRTLTELRTTLDKQVYRPTGSDTYFITFLHETPTAAQAKALADLSNDFEDLTVVGADVHWLMHGKSTESRLAKRHWEKILGTNTSTSRNTTMLRRLVAKAADR